MISFSCIWLLKTIFTFYMDVVDNNDFLNVFHVFGCLKQDLDFTWMLWIIMTSFDVFHVFGCLKQDLHFTWMLWIIMTSLMFFMYLVVENNIYILHRCCG